MKTLWRRYRKMRRVLFVAVPTLGLPLLFMEAGPAFFVIAIVWIAILTLACLSYLTEQVVWIAQNQGRPCEKCKQKVPVRSFSLKIQCPHCGFSE